MAGFTAPAFGAVAAIILRDIASRKQDIMLSFSTGRMLAASSFSLILPGIEAAPKISNNQLIVVSIVVLGLGLGVALMIGLDRFVPHDTWKAESAALMLDASIAFGCLS